jgi:hypothetical protein
MTRQLRRCIATSALLILLSLFMAASAFAAEAVGSVINASGPLLAHKSDGTIKVLALKSAVHAGDTLITEKDTYARIRFVDNSEITLRPNSQIRIDSFVFDEAKPENDSAKFNLVKGGLRAVTGALGKRSLDRVGVTTPVATIGIRGTTFIAEYVAAPPGALAAYAFATSAAISSTHGMPLGEVRSDAPAGFVLQPLPAPALQLAQGMSPPPGRAPGLYVQVLDGIINLSNKAGSQDYSPGQFGYVPSANEQPVILPGDPGMQFAPPPEFSSNSDSQGAGTEGPLGGVDCEVR